MQAKKLKILIVDDQAEMRSSVGRILRFEGYLPLEAPDGKSALEILSTQDIDVVLSDLRMPEMDGIELLHRLRQFSSKPFVLMTGFAEIAESAEAYEMGIDGFLLKPFQKSALLQSLRDAIAARDADASAENEANRAPLNDKFCGVPVSEFIGGREIRFPIFLKLSDAKYVRIAYTGEDLSSEKIRSLQAKGISFFYLQRDDFKQYVSFTSQVSNLIVSSPQIALTKKAAFLRHNSEVILELGFQQHLDREVFDMARLNVEQSLSLLSDSESLLDLLNSLTAHAQPLYSHSMGVALVACLVSRALGWESSPLFFRVVSGAILHDLGQKDFPPELQNKPAGERTTEETRQWREHPRIAADLLSKIEGLPEEVAQIALHHHELSDGSGFPSGLTGSKIHPVAKVISLADEFFHWYRGGPGYGNGLPPAEVIEKLESSNRVPGSLAARWDFLPALKKAFKPVP